jgi:hypothetical protein
VRGATLSRFSAARFLWTSVLRLESTEVSGPIASGYIERLLRAEFESLSLERLNKEAAPEKAMHDLAQ